MQVSFKRAFETQGWYQKWRSFQNLGEHQPHKNKVGNWMNPQVCGMLNFEELLRKLEAGVISCKVKVFLNSWATNEGIEDIWKFGGGRWVGRMTDVESYGDWNYLFLSSTHIQSEQSFKDLERGNPDSYTHTVIIGLCYPCSHWCTTPWKPRLSHGWSTIDSTLLTSPLNPPTSSSYYLGCNLYKLVLKVRNVSGK